MTRPDEREAFRALVQKLRDTGYSVSAETLDWYEDKIFDALDAARAALPATVARCHWKDCPHGADCVHAETVALPSQARAKSSAADRAVTLPELPNGVAYELKNCGDVCLNPELLDELRTAAVLADRAAIEAASRGTGDDTARLDWLEKLATVHVEGCHSGSFSGGNLQYKATVFLDNGMWMHETIRKAVDEAMKDNPVRDAAQGADRGY